MSRRNLLLVGVAGVALIALWLALVLSWCWLLLPPGVFCLFLFLTAEDAGVSTSRR